VNRVLFVCRRNAGPSQIAAAYFRQYADPGVAIAFSAGIDPAERLDRIAIAVMEEKGFHLSRARPKKLTPELVHGVTLVVTMGCGSDCPTVPGARRVDWEFEDRTDLTRDHARHMRDNISQRVFFLISSEGWGKTVSHWVPADDAK